MNNWIDADKQLPSDEKYKLVLSYEYDIDNLDYDLAWYCKEQNQWRWNSMDSCKVKYWMDLPNKPNKL